MKISSYTPLRHEERDCCSNCKQLPANVTAYIRGPHLVYLCTICAEELRDKLIQHLKR